MLTQTQKKMKELILSREDLFSSYHSEGFIKLKYDELYDERLNATACHNILVNLASKCPFFIESYTFEENGKKYYKWRLVS